MNTPPLESNLKDLLGEEREKSMGTTWKSMHRGSHDSAKPEAGNRDKGGQIHSLWQKNSVYSWDLSQRSPIAKEKEADSERQPASTLIGKRSEELEGRGSCKRELFLEIYVTKAQPQCTRIGTLRSYAFNCMYCFSDKSFRGRIAALLQLRGILRCRKG